MYSSSSEGSRLRVLHMFSLGGDHLLLNVNVPLIPKVANDKHENTRADGSYHEIRLRMKLRVHKAREC